MRLIILYFMLVATLEVSAQTFLNKSLSIGDTLPPMLLQKVLNAADGTIDLRDLNGKSLIIDFGGTYCPPCLESLLKMDSLQPKYADRLQMVMANKQTKKDWDILYSRNPVFADLIIPIITEDTLLYRLFKHVVEPHVVWVGADRKVKAITGHYYFSEQSIIEFLENKELGWPQKLDIRIGDSTRLITWNQAELDDGIKPKQKLTAFVSGYLPGVRSSQRVMVDSVRQEIRYVGINIEVLNIYKLALRTLGKLNNSTVYDNQIFLGEGVDSAMLFYAQKDNIPLSKWKEIHSVSYEVSVPMHYTPEKAVAMVWDNVSAYLGLDIKWKPKKMPVLVINDVMDVSGRSVVAERITDLIGRTEMSWKGVKIIDESNYTGRQKFLIRIPKVKLSTDIYQVKTALQQAGVDCHVEERSVDILAITQKEY